VGEDVAFELGGAAFDGGGGVDVGEMDGVAGGGEGAMEGLEGGETDRAEVSGAEEAVVEEDWGGMTNEEIRMTKEG
jgi:hypothetical protein